MALDSAKFNQIQQRAKRIMELDRQGQLDKYADSKSGILQEDGSISFDPITELSSTQGMSRQQPIQEDIANYSNAKKLPKAILESFASNQIDTAPLLNNVGSSVLDAIGVPQQRPQQKKRVITEQVSQPTQQVVTNSPIDYSLIKTIVEDCMRKNLSSIKKSLLSEGITSQNNDLALMKIGDNFKFVTKKGDIYEAKLVKIANVNDKR